ncbi:MAG: hypothetical protein HY518_02130, partial [Candidatus Aenigmarchaeota archaeon]|nr:hypothetical protein [Candidatus Aenigmarchaeota archaeon]
LGIIVLIAAALNLTVRLNFLIGDEIIIHLSPEQDSLSLHYGEQRKEGINLSVETHPYCTAFCAYTFGDKSRNIILDQGNLTLRAGEQIIREYTISPSRVGRGQDVYRFDVACHNLRSAICLANKEVKYRSSLIILNYDLSEQEKASKEESSAILLPLLSRLAELDSALKNQSERIISLAAVIGMEDLQEQKAAIEGNFSSLLLTMERFRTLWSSEAYVELRAQLDSPINESIAALGQNLTSLSQQIDGRVLRYNALMLRLKELASESNHAQDLYSLVQAANAANATNLSHLMARIENFGGRVNATFALLRHPEFGDYPAIEKSISEIYALSENLTNESRTFRSEEQARIRLSLGQEKDYLCLLERNLTSCPLNETIISLNEDYLSEKEKKWYEAGIAKDACDTAQNLEKAYAAVRNRTAMEITLRSITFEDNADNGEWNASVLNFSDSLKSNMLFEYAEDLSNTNNSGLLAEAAKILELPAAGIEMEDSNQTELKKLYLLSGMEIGNKTREFINSLCVSPKKYPFHFNTAEFSALNATFPYSGGSTIDTSLSQNPAVCCIFGECKEC